MQVHPGAPGTARQESTRTIVSTNDGGVATQQRAPGHERPRAASSGAARHGRLSAATRAPGADVPPATTAGAPGQYCLRAAPRAPGHGRPLATTAEAPCRDRLSAVPAAPDHDRSRARHTMAPGHERPPAASSDVAGHDRPCATPRAPGADVPPATTAEAPGQYRLSAVQRAPDHFRSRPAPMAPGHGRPLAASSDVAGHDRPRATLTAPGVDVPPATTAGAPGQHRLSAVAIATVASPAGLRRLRQVILPRTPATPNTLTYSHSRFTASSLRRKPQSSSHPYIPARAGIHPSLHGGEGPVAGHSRTTPGSFRAAATCHRVRPDPSPCTAGGLQGGQSQSTPSPGVCSGGGPGRGPLTTHQVHPAIQVPPYPRSCSAAHTGFLRQNPSRAPPDPCPSLRRKPQTSRTNE